MKESLSGKYYFSNFKYSTPRIGKLFLLSWKAQSITSSSIDL